MGRPVNTDSDDTRRRLVALAIEAFAQHGFAGASTRDLAARAQLNVATLNYHFASKQGLYDAAVDEVYRRLNERGRALLAEASFADVDQLMARVYSVARDERDGVRLLVRQVLDEGRLVGHTAAAHFLPELDEGGRLVAGLVGCSVEQARATVVALGYLLSRYVVQDEESLVAAFHVRSAKQAHARAVATLATLARALLSADAATAMSLKKKS